MKNSIIKAVALVLVGAALALLSVVPMQVGEADNSRWMADLDDERRLNSISIPGTHDSGALHSIADVSGKCQSLSIGEQLGVGVRFLDIRLQMVENKLRVVHSFVDQATDFESVLALMTDFVRENESEFLLVSIKEDADPVRSDKDFAEVLEEMLLSYPEVSRARELPETVGDARGKLHILSRYYGASIGLDCYSGWRDDTAFDMGGVYVQDNYCVESSEEKIADVRATYAEATEEKYSLVLNFTSCYLESSFPPIYAGLPAHDINPDIIAALTDEYPKGALGVLVCDFMTSELANAIIRRNF